MPSYREWDRLKEEDEMTGIKADKLSDDALEQVSGGTNKELSDLSKALCAKNVSEIATGLSDLNIKADLSSQKDNRYFDTVSKTEIDHKEVLNRIKRSK